MNGYQQLDQRLSCIHNAVCIVVNENKNGKRADVLATQLRLVLDEAKTVMTMIGCSPDERFPSHANCLPLLRKESLKALQEARRRNGGRVEVIATSLSCVLNGANDALIEMGQVI